MARANEKGTQAPDLYLQVPAYIEKWDDYFMWIAEVVARKSKDQNAQVGAVIVSDGVIVSTGYNGLARGVYDSTQILDDKDEKLKWICHAEFNAIMNAAQSGISLKGCTIYVNKFPCLACCNAIVQAGIVKLVTYDEWYWKHDPFDETGERKHELIRQTKLEVYAPRHEDYSPADPPPQLTGGAAADSESAPAPDDLVSQTAKSRKPARRAG